MDNVELLFFLIFVVISIVQSVIKKVNENREAERKASPPMPVRPLRPVADEFLTTARRRNSAPDIPTTDPTPALPQHAPQSPMAPQSPVANPSPVAVPSRNAGPAAQKQQRQRTGNPRKKSDGGTSGADRKGSTRAQSASADGSGTGNRSDSGRRPLADQESRIGSSVGQHVDNFLARRPPHVLSCLDDQVRTDMNTGLRRESASDSAGASRENQQTAAESIISALRNPAGVRQAMLVNEVLSRPKIFRR